MAQANDLITHMTQLYENAGIDDCPILERGLRQIIEDIPDVVVSRIHSILSNRNATLNDVSFSIVKKAIQEDLSNFSFDEQGQEEGKFIICGTVCTILNENGWQSQNLTWELEDETWLDNLIMLIQEKLNESHQDLEQAVGLPMPISKKRRYFN